MSVFDSAISSRSVFIDQVPRVIFLAMFCIDVLAADGAGLNVTATNLPVPRGGRQSGGG